MNKCISVLQKVTNAELINLEKTYLAVQAQRGDQQARDAIFEIYLNEIVTIALNQAGIDKDVYRLIEEGCLGLVYSLQQYQPEKDGSFNEFAITNIQKNILCSIERNEKPFAQVTELEHMC